MENIIELINLIGKSSELQGFFTILLLLFIAYSAVSVIQRSRITKSEGHGIGFFCKNTGRVFPIDENSAYIETKISQGSERERKLCILCVCGECHVLDVLVKFTNIPQEQNRAKIRKMKLP